MGVSSLFIAHLYIKQQDTLVVCHTNYEQ